MTGWKGNIKTYKVYRVYKDGEFIGELSSPEIQKMIGRFDVRKYCENSWKRNGYSFQETEKLAGNDWQKEWNEARIKILKAGGKYHEDDQIISGPACGNADPCIG